MRPLVCLAALILGCLPLGGGQIRLADGELFQYSLYCVQGFIPIPAGTATLSVTATNHLGKSAFLLGMTLDASPVIEKICHVRTRMASLVTPEFLPLCYRKSAEEGSRHYTETTTFTQLDTGECSVSCRREIKGGRVDTGQEVRRGSIYDLVSVCFFARGLQSSIPVGRRFPLAVVSGVKVRERTLVFRGEDKVSGVNGEKVVCDTFVLMGSEKKGESDKEVARFWISRDEDHVPVRIDMALKWGSVSVRLEKVGTRTSALSSSVGGKRKEESPSF